MLSRSVVVVSGSDTTLSACKYNDVSDGQGKECHRKFWLILESWKLESPGDRHRRWSSALCKLVGIRYHSL